MEKGEMKTAGRVVLAVILVLCVSLCCAPVFAGNKAGSSASFRAIAVPPVLHLTGVSTICLPASVGKDGIDGVVVEHNGQFVPVAISVKGNDLSITPSGDFAGGETYDVKIFTRSGKRYLIQARTEAFCSLDGPGENTVTIPAKPSMGFNYSYVLCVPKDIEKNSERRLLVNCVNTPDSRVQEFFQEQARLQATENTIHYLAMTLRTPCIVPAFPRQPGQGEYVYAQMLNHEAVQQDKVDKQLVAMIKDAQKQLEHNGIQVADKVFMYGYSTDAKFAQRFTVLHPDLVMATVAGGVAGITTFPMNEYDGETLNYPVGVADIKALTGSDFNKDKFAEVPQFFIMGETDTNDATQYRDCFRQQDADQINRLFGKNQMPDRWNATQRVLLGVSPKIKCKTYSGIGHSMSSEMNQDIVDFYKEHWNQ